MRIDNFIKLILLNFWKEPAKVILEREYRGRWILPTLISFVTTANISIAKTSPAFLGDPSQDFALEFLLLIPYFIVIYVSLVKILPFIYFKLGSFLGGKASFSDIQYAVLDLMAKNSW